MIVCSEVNLRTSNHPKKYCIISVIFVIVDLDSSSLSLSLLL